MRLPHVALVLVSAALGASSCIFLVDEAKETGAGGTGGAGQASAGVTSGGGATTSSTGNAGGGGEGGGAVTLTITEQGVGHPFPSGLVSRVARTPTSNALPLVFAGIFPAQHEFVVFDPNATVDHFTRIPSLGGAGLALVAKGSSALPVEDFATALRVLNEDGDPIDPDGTTGCAGNITDIASMPGGTVFARCGAKVVAVPISATPQWGNPVDVTTVANATKTKVRTARGSSSGTVHVLWDDDVPSGEGVRWSSCSSSFPLVCPSGGARRFEPTTLTDFGYSEEADTVFAIGGVQLHGAAAGSGGGTHLFSGYAVHAFAVRGPQIAFAATSTINARKILAACFVDTDFVDAAKGPAAPDDHCAVLELPQALPPHMVVLTEDHVYTVTAAGGGGPAEPRLRRYLLQ